MQPPKPKSTIKNISIILLVVFLIFSGLPYVIPVKQQFISREDLRFDNSQYFQYNNTLIHYRIFEPETQPAKGNLLLIHGYMGSTFSWRHNDEFFQQLGYKVLSVDMPGFGLSDKENFCGFSHSEKAAMLKTLCQLVDNENQWIVFGHSMGGTTALYLSALYPDLAEKAVIIAGAYRENDGNKFLKKLKRWPLKYPPIKAWANVIAHYYLLNIPQIQKLVSYAYGTDATEEDALGYLQPFLIENSLTAVVKMRSQVLTEIPINISTDIDIPVLLIWGENDQIVPLSVGQRLIELIPNSNLITLPETGHCPMQSHPDTTNEIIEQWLLKLLFI